MSILTDIIKGIPGVITSGLTSGISSLLGGANARDQYRRAIEAQEAQASINENMYRNRYQWTTEDMKKAGLNPILAASGGFSVGSGPTVGLPSPAFSGMPLTPSIAASSRDMESVGKIEQETKKIKEEIKLTTKRIETEITLAVKNRAEAKLLGAKEREAAGNILRMIKEANKLVSQATMYEAEKELIVQNTKVAKRILEKIGFELKRLKEVSKIYAGPSKEVYGWLEAVSRILGLKTGMTMPVPGLGRRR